MCDLSPVTKAENLWSKPNFGCKSIYYLPVSDSIPYEMDSTSNMNK